MLVKEPETVNTYETINHVLVHLFNEIWELEEKAIITEEYKTEYYRRITYDIDEQSCE